MRMRLLDALSQCAGRGKGEGIRSAMDDLLNAEKALTPTLSRSTGRGEIGLRGCPLRCRRRREAWRARIAAGEAFGPSELPAVIDRGDAGGAFEAEVVLAEGIEV